MKFATPSPEELAPFNSLNALFPYYNVDPASISKEELMPVLIEDIFLSEDFTGVGDQDYDLLPFYDLENYDLSLDENFIVYDATSEGNIEKRKVGFLS